MGWVRGFYRSTIGRKVVMAVTGMGLVTFVTLHMAGNLLMFRGAEAMNAYAHLLQRSGALLWGLRAGLLVAALLHVHSAWTLARDARRARPAAYARETPQSSTWAARSMRWGGVLLLAFLVFHLLHFTTGTVHPAFARGDAYGNVVAGFGVPLVALFYLLAMGALALHLHHGVASLFQTLGMNHPHVNPLRRRLAGLLAVLVPAGFAAVPLAVLLGLVG